MEQSVLKRYEIYEKAQTVSLIFGIAGALLLGSGMIIKRERKKIAPEIIRLTDELMK